MGTWNFSEFIIFFQKGWNPFKIHGRFKLDWVPKFYIMSSVGIWSLANEQSCSSCSNLALCKVLVFLDPEKAENLNYIVWRRFEEMENGLELWIWPGPMLQCWPAQIDSTWRSFGQSVGRDRATAKWSFLSDRLVPPSPLGSTRSPCSTTTTCATPVTVNPYLLWASMRGQSWFDFPHP
jgi:hypothetical protein